VSCAVFLATLFPGIDIANLDRTRIYEVPGPIVAATPVSKVWLAKACAIKYGIHWRIGK